MEANRITVIDEAGNEKNLEILFTFNSDEFQKDYVVYYDPEVDEGVYVSSYDQEGHLFDVEGQEEWDMVEEVFDAFLAESEEGACAHCGDEDCQCEGGCNEEKGCCCGDQ